MNADSAQDSESAPCRPCVIGQVGADFSAAFREGLDRAIAILDDLDESGVVLARLELAAAQGARDGVPIEVVQHAVRESVQTSFGLVEPSASHTISGVRVDGVHMVEVLELLTAAVSRAYGMHSRTAE
ncbi:hypothetical protein [Nocardia sp. NPDC050710]|uniref:hypothetical protein n=1 Tax=Nocardia sp. NPDC050710 TaxID=3157220 RepID=UPI0033DBDE6B